MPSHLPESSPFPDFGSTSSANSSVGASSVLSALEMLAIERDRHQSVDPEKASPYRTARAYIQILGLLTKSRWITASEIQGRLEQLGWCYGKRAVEKMLKSLADEHPGIERDDSTKPYRYRWCQDQSNPWNPDLSDRESLTLLLAVEHLRNLLPYEVHEWLSGRFREARQRLDPQIGVRPLNTWQQKVAVVDLLPAMQPPHISAEVYQNVSQALLKDCWLNVDYRNAEGQMKLGRRVMPLALVQQGVRLFLVCRFEEFQDIRHLALHRMLVAQATPHQFVRPKDFSLHEYIASGGFGFSTGEMMCLILKVKPHIADLLEETPFSTDQVITRGTARQSDATVKATVPRSEQMRWWIRMQGQAVEVLAPHQFMSDGGAT